MNESSHELTALSENRTRLAWVLTAVVGLCFVSVFGFKWEKVWDMDPNEWGDFLAGFSSAVAFIWLVVGYYQQNEDIKLQIMELKLSVDAQQAQADTLKQERKAARHRASPRFLHNGHGDFSDIRGAYVRFKNVGAPADILNVSISEGGDVRLRGASHVQQNEVFIVDMPGLLFKERHGQKLLITYRNAEGELGASECEIFSEGKTEVVREIFEPSNNAV